MKRIMDAVGAVPKGAAVSAAAVSWRPEAAGRRAYAGSNADCRGRGALAKTSESDEKSAFTEYPSILRNWSGSSFILREGPWFVSSENGCGRMANGFEIARSNEQSAVVAEIDRASVNFIRDPTASRKKNEVPAGERMRRRSIIERGKWKVLGYAEETEDVNNNGATVDVGQVNWKISKPGRSVTTNLQDSTESIIIPFHESLL